jgi:ribonuclease HI
MRSKDATIHFDGSAKPEKPSGFPNLLEARRGDHPVAGYLLHGTLGDRIRVDIASGGVSITEFNAPGEYAVTDEQAAFVALICALREAGERGLAQLVARGSSRVVIDQMNGAAACSAETQPLCEYAKELAKAFSHVAYELIPTTENKEAVIAANNPRGDVVLDLGQWPPVTS